MFLQVCVSSFTETRFLIPRLNSARCQQHLIIFSTHEQRLAGSSYYQHTRQKYSLYQGGGGHTGLGEIVGWGGRVTNTSSSLGTPVPHGSLHRKMEENRFSKESLEQEPT